ncbi:AMP-binding protein, partial [Bosea sp. 117]|uniref:AMP-binding protein n=1 Tax=Bosea sp. 117 TaxID=1125973 RepID=UPI000494B42D
MPNHLIDRLRAGGKDSARPFSETPDGRRITCGDLERRTAQYANALVALGVKPGDRVALQVEKSLEAVFA